MFDMIRAQMNQAVPFAAHAGVVLTSISPDRATAELAEAPTSLNHIGSQHAGALFTLGEAASGAAMAGVFAPVLLDVRPVASGANIRYSRVARGPIVARAQLSGEGSALLDTLAREGKVAFDVAVSLTDAQGQEVAGMTVSWRVSKRRGA
jgi:acyl-coenzyme A thioesterase PaaI-like protein